MCRAHRADALRREPCRCSSPLLSSPRLTPSLPRRAVRVSSGCVDTREGGRRRRGGCGHRAGGCGESRGARARERGWGRRGGRG
eukprot:3933074-Rhodomonas_salina.1